LRVGRVLDHPVGKHQVERVRLEGKLLAVRHPEICLEPLLLEILAGQYDGGAGDVDPARDGSPAREPREVGARAAADVEHPASAERIEIDQPWKVMEFLEVVLIEILEEFGRSWRRGRDIQIMNVLIPISTNVCCRRRAGGRHGAYYKVKAFRLRAAALRWTSKHATT
jgi:hypothetical protein